MELRHIPLHLLHPASWNPNVMSQELLDKLRRSVEEFGLVENLVVRRNQDGYEVLSGNQRLKVYRELGLETAPCVVVDLPDAQARLLAQVLNRTRGEDDLGLKASLLRQLRESLDLEELSRYLPEGPRELEALLSIGETTIEAAFARWAQREENPLHTLTFALRPEQLEVVSQALEKAQQHVKGKGLVGSPRTAALVHICRTYIEGRTMWGSTIE